MMIAKKKEFYGGMGMMGAFVIVLIIIFSPVFSGMNGLDDDQHDIVQSVFGMLWTNAAP